MPKTTSKKPPKPRKLIEPPTPQDVLSVTEKYRLDAKDQQLLALVMEYPDAPLHELGEVLGGISKQAVHQRVTKPAFKKALSELLMQQEDLIAKIRNRALRKLQGLLNSNNERIALEAARLALGAILDPKSGADISMPVSITFKTRISESGSVTREVETIEAEKTNTSP